MKKLVTLAAAGVSLAALALPAQAQVAGDKIPGSYVCVFKKGSVGRGNAQAEANRAAQAAGAQVSHVYSVAIQGFAANMPEQAVERVKAANPNIEYCEQDQVFTHGPIVQAGPPSGDMTAQSTQETPWGIARVGGGAAGTFATAWVIDSGVQLNHPDLRVDVARSRSFIRDTSPNDANGHGTHVAGTIAALDNTIGVIGVAPGATVVAVRVLDRRGSGTTSGVIAGVDYVAQFGRPGDVANMSLGGGVSPRSTPRWSMRRPAAFASPSRRATRATMPTTTRRRVPTAPTCSPSRPSRSATSGRAIRTSAIRRSNMPSPARPSSRPG
jgi:subtilisin family serine protease